ncbi:hypothetical protein [Actinacidiphila oryziradicis]|uniref:hypothetical protein n=1 Tax=Actinacidiphila oryziradicis TaxID=2571141 RepID=UPI0023F0D863|nr:hypothetical protein [Actinacidiphila oryziradicis]
MSGLSARGMVSRLTADMQTPVPYGEQRLAHGDHFRPSRPERPWGAWQYFTVKK